MFGYLKKMNGVEGSREGKYYVEAHAKGSVQPIGNSWYFFPGLFLFTLNSQPRAFSNTWELMFIKTTLSPVVKMNPKSLKLCNGQQNFRDGVEWNGTSIIVPVGLSSCDRTITQVGDNNVMELPQSLSTIWQWYNNTYTQKLIFQMKPSYYLDWLGWRFF